ncbi:hypothetical protein SAMN02745673_00420 [Marinactinospora thermotolerans DSM 45154]|uniref:Uncharacterized protein n=1 Tax=Marinactinospora thermotolerans DSM 45154 TaxID=1122192 RepID=A0A1T4KK59_9ACTN|nr:hypothetical protein [Marinactinospora thermotolerans]SJZ42790.1 hypothetical protein SAMN02745673_00420 [Marinactinospora thermotolerans DSM 45154]
MTTPGTNNTAESNSYVGIQAEQVHDSTVYMVLPDSPPNCKYQVGLRYLENGIPIRSRELIAEAIAHGYDGGEVRFHWVLAVLSKRSHRDLTPEEREGLNQISAELHKYPNDEWKRALEVIFKLLGCLDGAEADVNGTIRELRSLTAQQRDKIARHLDLVLTGKVKESLWVETRQAAQAARDSNNRIGRVWAYFEPLPAYPRVREPAGYSITLGDYTQAVFWSALLTCAVGCLGWLVLEHARLSLIVVYLLALAAGCVGARNGFQWHYKIERMRAKERDYIAPSRSVPAPEKGFANQVDHSFNYYFNKYAPEGVDLNEWLADTAGIRKTLRDEIVEIYRESRIGARKVDWLIRYMVRDVRSRWRNGTLLEHRERYKVETSTKAWCILSCVVLVVAAGNVIVGAFQESAVTAVIAGLAIVLSGRFAVPLWIGIAGERRRIEEDYQEYHQIKKERKAEYERWRKKLDDTRPREDEMESWLNSDKMLILDGALRHYRLTWNDIIAHAFLQTPKRPYKRARAGVGPWRYSKYEIRVFLITREGVREVVADLDFERIEVSSRERDNFRFDAVSSVHVEEGRAAGYVLNLTLMNGPVKRISVTEPETGGLEPSEDSDELFKVNLDASGFAHTLRILEGIAAEGEKWFVRYSVPSSEGKFASVDVRLDAAPVV